MGVDDRPSLLGRLLRVAATLPPADTLSWRLCEAVRQVAVADGASLALVTGTRDRMLVASTGRAASDLEELHADLGEGPAVTAVETDEVVSADLRLLDPQWARFAESATRRTGAALVVAVPMHAGPEVVGTLMLHRTSDGGFRTGVAEMAQLADLLTVALLQDSRPAARSAMEGSSARATVNQAVGMVMAQLALDADDALAVIRAHAYALDQPVAQVAASLVDRGLTFSPDDPP